ncbi:MAG: hypothetical protein JWM02_3076 [Frankiales bacterium]|nr:hypothetical protein [Frankiales bacterium]
MSILGQDVRITEKVIGRLTVCRAALAGMATGVWLGLFIGFVVWIVGPWAPEALLSVCGKGHFSELSGAQWPTS